MNGSYLIGMIIGSSILVYLLSVLIGLGLSKYNLEKKYKYSIFLAWLLSSFFYVSVQTYYEGFKISFFISGLVIYGAGSLIVLFFRFRNIKKTLKDKEEAEMEAEVEHELAKERNKTEASMNNLKTTAEQLQDLKNLFDKDLLSKEVYDERQREILSK